MSLGCLGYGVRSGLRASRVLVSPNATPGVVLRLSPPIQNLSNLDFNQTRFIVSTFVNTYSSCTIYLHFSSTLDEGPFLLNYVFFRAFIPAVRSIHRAQLLRSTLGGTLLVDPFNYLTSTLPKL